MDSLSRAGRSAMMSRIRGRGNRRTEIGVISLFRKMGIKGWRRHHLICFASNRIRTGRASDGTTFKLQVRPDISFTKLKVAVFVDGCFWHGCSKCYRRPKSRTRFWTLKAIRNKERDRFQTLVLKRSGWRVLRIWEHELTRNPERCVERLHVALRKTR